MEKLRKFLSVVYAYSHFAYIVLGVCLIIFHHQITHVFPYVFGGITLAIGIMGIVLPLLKTVKDKHVPTAYAYGITLTILGVLFLVKASEENIILYIAIAWALVSIVKGTMQLSYGIEQAKQKLKRSIFNFAQAIFSIVIAILLLIEPTAESIMHHIILLGVELIVSSVAAVGGLEEEVSLWNMLKLSKKEKNKTEEDENSLPSEQRKAC